MLTTTPAQARNDWQILFPNPEHRRQVASVMAETIARAHAANPACWMLKYRAGRPYLNINIGRAFAFSVRKAGLTVLLDDATIPPGVIRDSWKGGGSDDGFRSIEGLNWIRGPIAEILDAWGQLEPCYYRGVDRVIASAGIPNWWRQHDQVAVEMLAEASGRSLPAPQYPAHTVGGSGSLEELVDEFSRTYPMSDAGRLHAEQNREALEAFRRSFRELRARRAAREDITVDVLTRLLPHQRTEANLARGAWITTAPVLKTDIRKFLEGGRKAKPGDWPIVAGLIMDLFEACSDDPTQLPAACARFVAQNPAKGMQSALMSPGLNVINPEAFAVVNAKPIAAVQRFLNVKRTPKFAEFPQTNADVMELIGRAADGLRNIDELDGLPLSMRFDMFTHWLVAVRPTSDVRYWKIAPGEQAFNWESCRQGGFISMGWEKFSDISVLSRDEFDEMAQTLAGQDDEYSPAGTTQLWVFAHEIRKGDRIIANKGLSRILGVGTIDGEYYFEPEVVHGHRLPVRWDEFAEIEVPKQGWMKTIVSLKRQQFEELVGGSVPPPPPPPGSNVWMFQANPKLFNLEYELQVEGLEAIDAWKVAIFKDRMKPGDTALLWQSGKKAGIYAVAELTGPVFEITTDTADEFVEPGGHKVPLRITQVLDKPVTKAQLLEIDALANLHILKAPFGTNFKVSAEEWQAIRPLLATPVDPKRLTLKQAAAETGFSETDLQRWLNAIDRKGQGVLYGPPGTGKTYVAERLAKLLIGNGRGFHELVQFHPAYTYEDFIQGLRPVLTPKGGMDYRLVPGRFLEFCRKAERYDGTCVLILDEINRANLARVFGELMYLLEYRDQTVPLASGGELRIPKNVRVIGTMNTADRSIALVDHALRRRFAFIHLRPQYAVLEKYHQGNGFDADALVKVLKRLNVAIDDPHYELGISYFLRKELGDHIEDIWRMEIEPYLEEYFFDQAAKAQEYSWDKLKTELQ